MVISATSPARPQTLATAVVRVTFIFYFLLKTQESGCFSKKKKNFGPFSLPSFFAFDSLLPLLSLTPPPGAGSSLSPFSTPFSRT